MFSGVPVSVDEYVSLLLPFEKNLSLGAPLALMVSGGADSLALLWLTHQWIQRHQSRQRYVAVTVNHHLRAESTEEIQVVQRLTHSWGIEHVILEWLGPKPSSALQAKARQARYDLMPQWCQQQRIENVFLGHHLQDQVETFISRLCHHSTYYGLACMAPQRREKNIILMRPLLSLPKERLKATLTQAGISWIEDPSNTKNQFERVRIRGFLENVAQKEGLIKKIQNLIGDCAVLRQVIEEKVEHFLGQPGIIDPCGYIKIPLSLLLECPWIEIERILDSSIRLIGGKKGFFRIQALKKVWEALCCSSGQKTYGGCILQHKKGILWIFCEETRKKNNQIVLGNAFFQVNYPWDHRFHLTFTKDNLKLKNQKFLIKSLGLAGWRILPKDIKQELLKKAPLHALLTIPVIWENDQIAALPWTVNQKEISYELVFKSMHTAF